MEAQTSPETGSQPPSESNSEGARLRHALTVLVLGAVIVALIVTVLLSRESSPPPFIEYANADLGFAIQHPEDWTVATLAPGSRLFGSDKVVTLSKGSRQVLIGIDVETTWCEGADDTDVTVIQVSGVSGEDHRCYRDRALTGIVRHFEEARAGRSYTVLSQPPTDAETAVRIVESFRFLP